MAKQPMHLQVGYAFTWPSGERSALPDGDETRRVETVVVALISEYHQVKVRDDEGHVYSLTRKTEGIDLAALHEGQRIVCTVTRKLPRVHSAAAVA